MRERSYEVNIRKVAGGRIDGTLIGSITGPYLAQRLALADKVEFLPKALGKVELGVALSRQLFNEEANRRFQIQITQLQKSQRWQDILNNNNVQSLVKPWPLVN
jgi:ABC-type amino acid transport substrate-binding protein